MPGEAQAVGLRRLGNLLQEQAVVRVLAWCHGCCTGQRAAVTVCGTKGAHLLNRPGLLSMMHQGVCACMCDTCWLQKPLSS